MKHQLNVDGNQHFSNEIVERKDLISDPQSTNSSRSDGFGGHSSSRTRWRQWGDCLSRRAWYLDPAKLCMSAQRRTSLEDFGDPPLEPGLSVLANSLEDEAQLHPLGRFLMRFHLRGLLETRLRLAELWRGQSKSLACSSVERPIFITGMPRSGSTFLHELLAEDAENRAPRVWEVMFPIPERETEVHKRDPRITRAAACLWWFRRLAPEADAVYPMRACTPHECVAIHSYSFLSEEFISTCRVQSYETFLRIADLRPAYAWERRFLQYLQSGRPSRRWVLKSPDHSRSLEELFAVFPDALIVQTHRNPLEVLNSSCQLTEVLHRLYGRAGKHEEVIAHESKLLAEGAGRAIGFRDAHRELEDRFVDVKYTELISDPLAAIRRIYGQFGIPLNREAADRMRRLAGIRRRYPNPRSRGALSGLKSLAAVERGRFEQYCARFGIAFQSPRLR